MIGLAKSKPKPFDVILVWKFSRFARNREDSVVYKSMLRKELNIDVVSISEDVGDDKMAILFEAMIEAMDEYYSIILAEEVKRGMTEKEKRGGVLSIPGLVISDGTHIPIDMETWDKVHYRMNLQKEKFGKYYNADRKDLSHWLSGIVRCKKCGAVLSNQGVFSYAQTDAEVHVKVLDTLKRISSPGLCLIFCLR